MSGRWVNSSPEHNGSDLSSQATPFSLRSDTDASLSDLSTHFAGVGQLESNNNSDSLRSNSSSVPSPMQSLAIGDIAKNSLERNRQNLQKPRRLESDTSADSLASHTGNQNNANNVSTAKKYNIKKQSAVRNIINKFDNITRTSPENDLYRLLKNEAAKILNYVKQYKADTATINNVELLFKYYVYFKILSKIVKSNGTKYIDKIVKDKVRKYKYNPIPDILIKDKYAEKFNAFISTSAYSQWFDDIVKKMNDHNKKIKNYLNNIRNN
jgi:hypothetical protein